MLDQVGRRVFSDEVGHQALVPRSILARHYHGLADRRMPRENRLDFAKLDAEASDLDLVIGTAQTFQQPIGTPARQVAGAIQARVRREWTLHETFRSQLGTVQIATRQTLATDVQLANHCRRNQFAVGIEHVGLRVGDRPADRRLTVC